MNPAAVLVLLLVIVAWLTAGSMAVRTVSRIWLRHWVEQRLHGAERADVYLERPQRLIIASGAGIAFAVFAGGIVIGMLATTPERTAEYVIAAALVVLMVGQVIPRAIARRWAPELVPVLLPPLRLLDFVTSPIAVLARQLLGRRKQRAFEDANREGIEELLREGELEGVGEREEIAIITGVVEFGQKTVAEVMTPRNDVFALERSTPPLQLAQLIAQSEYSRVPIYEGTLDQVVGMVHAFDVLKAGGDELPPLRPVAVALPGKHCNELLFEMLRKRMHLAIVREEGGRTIGVVTLEDLLEELVGDIRDEHDEPAATRPSAAPERLT